MIDAKTPQAVLGIEGEDARKDARSVINGFGSRHSMMQFIVGCSRMTESRKIPIARYLLRMGRLASDRMYTFDNLPNNIPFVIFKLSLVSLDEVVSSMLVIHVFENYSETSYGKARKQRRTGKC